MSFAKIRPRRGTATQWETANPILAEGEEGIEVPNEGVGTGEVKIKYGDGVTAWNDLPYGVKPLEVVDNLLSESTELPLSANQGRMLDKKCFAYRGILQDKDNLDNYFTIGIYRNGNTNFTFDNCPVNGSMFELEVIGNNYAQNVSDFRGIQRITTSSGNMWTRDCGPNGWTDWKTNKSSFIRVNNVLTGVVFKGGSATSVTVPLTIPEGYALISVAGVTLGNLNLVPYAFICGTDAIELTVRNYASNDLSANVRVYGLCCKTHLI